METAGDLIELGQSLQCRVTEVAAEESRVVVSCGLGRQGWGRASMAGLTLSWLAGAGLASRHAEHNHRVGDLVSGRVQEVSEAGALVELEGGVTGVVPGSQLPCPAPTPASLLCGLVVWADPGTAPALQLSSQTHLLSKVATRRPGRAKPRPGTAARGYIVATRAEHGLASVLLINPAPLAGTPAYLSTRRHLNDLVGWQDEQEEEGREVELVVAEVSETGEVIVVLEREVRQGEKANKRARQSSLSENKTSKDESPKKRKKESETGVHSATLVEAEPEPNKSESNEETTHNSVESVSTDPQSVPEQDVVEPIVKKKKKSKKKKLEDAQQTEAESAKEAMETESEAVETVSLEKKKKKSKKNKDHELESINIQIQEPGSKPKSLEVTDPGWDFSATCLTTPAWRHINIWSEDEMDEGEEEEGEKRLSKAEAKKARQAEEAAASAREAAVAAGQQESPVAPLTVEEWERAVAGSPDSAVAWVGYMASVMQVSAVTGDG